MKYVSEVYVNEIGAKNIKNVISKITNSNLASKIIKDPAKRLAIQQSIQRKILLARLSLMKRKRQAVKALDRILDPEKRAIEISKINEKFSNELIKVKERFNKSTNL